MNQVRFARRAREDLLDIWLYLAPRTSEAVADRVYDRIEESCHSLDPIASLAPRDERSRRTLGCLLSRGGLHCAGWLKMERRSWASSMGRAISPCLNRLRNRSLGGELGRFEEVLTRRLGFA